MRLDLSKRTLVEEDRKEQLRVDSKKSTREGTR